MEPKGLNAFLDIALTFTELEDLAIEFAFDYDIDPSGEGTASGTFGVGGTFGDEGGGDGTGGGGGSGGGGGADGDDAGGGLTGSCDIDHKLSEDGHMLAASYKIKIDDFSFTLKADTDFNGGSVGGNVTYNPPGSGIFGSLGGSVDDDGTGNLNGNVGIEFGG